MKRHVGDVLYEHALGDLSATDRAHVEEHLAGCAACAADLRELRAALAVLPRPSKQPSDERTPAFWTAFANDVGSRILAPERRTLSRGAAIRDQIASFVTFNRSPLLAGTGVLALVAAAMLLFWPRPADVRQPDTFGAGAPSLISDEPAQRMNEYLKRSKVLLVGIANMNTGEGHPVDLSAERDQSRALVHEARYLRRQPMDARSARLIGDLEKILIELANIEEHQDIPNVEMIRTGIRRENLIFKIRMAETLMDASEIERKLQ